MAAYPSKDPPWNTPPPPYSPHPTNHSQNPYQPSSSGLKNSISSIGGQVTSFLTGATRVGMNAVSKALQPSLMSHFENGNIIQLISRKTGKTLQILQAPSGQLVMNGQGGDGPQFVNTHFTVIRISQSSVALHNNFNYLAVKGGIAQLFSAGPNGPYTDNCKFKVRDPLMQSNFVALESAIEKNGYLGVLANGDMKSALATTLSDHDVHFGVRLIYSPYSPVAATTVIKK